MTIFRAIVLFSLIIGGVLCAGDQDLSLTDAKFVFENNRHILQGKTIRAVVEADGCMTKLKVLVRNQWPDHVASYIHHGIGLPNETGVGGSRGAYFFQDGILAMDKVELVGDRTLKASSKKAEVIYESTDQALLLKLSNKTDREMQYFLVMDPVAVAVAQPGKEFIPTPAIRRWKSSVWYWDEHKLTVSGVDGFWSPAAATGIDLKNRIKATSVVEVLLPPMGTRTVSLTPGHISKENNASLKERFGTLPNRGGGPTSMLNPKPAAQGEMLTLFSPWDYQVFQRQTFQEGKLFISGNLKTKAEKDLTVSYRLTGKSLQGELPAQWQTLALNPVFRSFAEKIAVPAGGWYQLEVQARRMDTVMETLTIEHVGMGEVFIGCGQSNSTNYGEKPTKTATGMVGTFGGEGWTLANDPQPGTYNNSRYGSFWPSFGDELFKKLGVPIGVAVTGRGGAPVWNWRPGRSGFLWTVGRMAQLGPQGFRAVLFHQGESNRNTKKERYTEELLRIIQATRAAAGWHVPWFVATTSYQNPTHLKYQNVRDAQKAVCDSGLALAGPDTDTLVGKDRCGIHLSVQGLKNHGRLWSQVVENYLERLTVK